MTKKRIIIFEDDGKLKHCSDIVMRLLVNKKEDLSALKIPCTIVMDFQRCSVIWVLVLI